MLTFNFRAVLCYMSCRPGCPTMLNYTIAAENGSMYNTPPCWPIYICGLVFKHLLKLGGLAGGLVCGYEWEEECWSRAGGGGGGLRLQGRKALSSGSPRACAGA
jgi:hypothetical protein